MLLNQENAVEIWTGPHACEKKLDAFDESRETDLVAKWQVGDATHFRSE